jgi:hypothetical protein
MCIQHIDKALAGTRGHAKGLLKLASETRACHLKIEVFDDLEVTSMDVTVV